MADLLHLMDELEDAENREEEGVYKAGGGGGRPSLAPTEATTPMSPDEDGGGSLDYEEEWDTANQEKLDIPVALQEAQNQQRKQQEKQMQKDSYTNKSHYYYDQEEEQQLVPNELYGQIHHLWMQERQSPELLPYDEVAIEEFQRQMEEQQDRIDELESTGQAVESLLSTLGQMDLDRAKFALSDWLSCRLTKIEAHPLYMRECISNMSESEIEYLKQYGALLEHHLRQSVLDHIPEAWQALDESNMIDRPDEEGYHFWLVKEALVGGGGSGEDEDAVEDDVTGDHDVGTCLVAKYKDMKKHLEAGRVEIQF